MSRFHRLLRVDLTRQQTHEEEIPASIEAAFLGGKGMATAYLSMEVPAGADPLGPENRLYLALGPLNGTMAPASARYEIVTKSPLTGLYLNGNSGGHLGAELKGAGYDMVAIEGIADRPTVLFIHDQQVRFVDGSEFWGLGIYDAETAVRKRFGDPSARVLSIGPAGERQVRLACVANDYSRQAARGGVGAVLGAKRLKAIAVRGTRDIPLARPAAFLQAVDEAIQVIRNNPWVESKRRYGTPHSIESMNEAGVLPVQNFTLGYASGAARFDHNVYDQLTVARLACAECPVACSKGTQVRQGYYQGQGMEGPEYETIGLLGPNCGIDDPEAIQVANYLCNQLGLDTISAGALIGALLYALDRGMLTHAQLDLDPKAERREWAAALLHAIAYREGIGDLLAMGSRVAGHELGILPLMPQIKGLDFPAYDVRASDGTALTFMTADRGACHLQSWPLGRELSGELERFGPQGKAAFVKNQQDDKAAEESLIVCQFPYGIGLLDEVLVRMLNAATGEAWDLASLRLAGERTWNLGRMFNVREGITRQDDYLPDKFAEEPLGGGPCRGRTISRETQDRMLDEYYALRGWTRDGLPTPETLSRLGLSQLVGNPPSCKTR